MNQTLLQKLLYVETQCVNPQDALIIRLLIEGFDVHEIAYLKHESLDVHTNTISIKDGLGMKKRLNISTICSKTFKAAINQSHYIRKNGLSASSKDQDELRKSTYAIKVSLKDYVANECMIQEIESVILRTIYRRLRNIAEIFNFPEISSITAHKLRSENLIYA